MTSPTNNPVAERIIQDVRSTLLAVTTANVSEPFYFNTILVVDRYPNVDPKQRPYLWIEDGGDAPASMATRGTGSRDFYLLMLHIHFDLDEREMNSGAGTGPATFRRMVHDIQKAMLYTDLIRKRGATSGSYNAIDTKCVGVTPRLSSAGTQVGGHVSFQIEFSILSNDPTQETGP